MTESSVRLSLRPLHRGGLRYGTPALRLIIVIVEHIEHTFDFCDHFGIVDISGVGGDHILFGGEEGVACGFKSLANGRKIGGRSGSFKAVVLCIEIVSAGVESSHHEFFLIDFCAAFNDDMTLLVEHPGDAAGVAHAVAVFVKQVADFLAVRLRLSVRTSAMTATPPGARSLVSAAFVVNGAEFACRLFDGAGDVVVGHVACLCFCNNIAGFELFAGSLPPSLTAITISLPIFVKTLPL